MCGIAGILLKNGDSGIDTGPALIDMLDGCQHRGPDSTGFALYESGEEGQLKLRFHVGSDNEAGDAIAALKEVFDEHGAFPGSHRGSRRQSPVQCARCHDATEHPVIGQPVRR